MSLNLGLLLRDAGIDPSDAIVIRHSYVDVHEDGEPGVHADSTDEDILRYTAHQSPDPRNFPATPPRLWIVFIREDGGRARLWSVLENLGELENSGGLRVFNLAETSYLHELRNRLVIGWRVPIRWNMSAARAVEYPVVEVADAKPVPFPGFDNLILSYQELQAVMRESRYASWRTALASVKGIYLITDLQDGRQYIGKADGALNILQRWQQYAKDGHGGNKLLIPLDPSYFRFSLLRVFDPSELTGKIDQAESHFKLALGSRAHGLNDN